MDALNIRVKICGLQDAAAAHVAVQAGADALGLILAPSRRQITPAHALSIRSELTVAFDEVPPMVGVVVNATAGEINRCVTEGGFDIIQLSGDEEPELLDSIEVPAIRALRLLEGTTVDEARREITRWLDRPNPAMWMIVEGHAAGSYGGTGARADWNLVAALAWEFPLWLAGGLDPDNVSEAISTVRPFGVDVSSGTEIDGVKDHAKIEAFISSAHASLGSAS